jgi:CubicO group peptidase (beta-lactamase class C family)
VLRLAAVLLAGLAAMPATAQDPMLGGIAVPGYAAVALAADGKMQAIGAGAAEFDLDGRPLRAFGPQTPVRVASISKVAVALALHRLADRGLLRLDADVSDALGWRLRNPHHPDVPITIRQMMRHESSLSDAGGYVGVLGGRQRDRIGPASFSAAAPGMAFDYANLNQALLGEVIEQVTGKRFDRAVGELVFAPLGIEACFNWSGCRAETVAAGAVLYRKAPSDEGPWDAAGPWLPQVDAKRPPEVCPVRLAEGAPCALDGYAPGTDGSLFSPQGGMRISIENLALLGQALLRDDDFLKPATREALFRPVRVKAAGAGAETNAGLMQYWSEGGLHCFSGTGRAGGDQPLSPAPMAGCGHLGDAYGLRSGLVVDPDAGTVVAYGFTGVSAPPPPGQVSQFSAPEEALVRKAYLLLSADNSANP